MRRRWIKRILWVIGLCLWAVFVGGVTYYITGIEPIYCRPVNPAILQDLPLAQLTLPEIDLKVKSSFDFEPYTSVNPETAGYINIYGTGLEELVMQSQGDRDYYLHRDWMGNYDVHGTVYFDNNFDYRNPDDKVWILYGHNNANGSGFPQLHNYNADRKGKESALQYYKEHYLMQLDTVEEAGEWQVFGLFVFSNNLYDGEHFDFMDTYFASNEDYQAYIDKIKIRSLINTPVEVTTDDQIALLVTCITDGYNYYGNQYLDWRLIMAAKRVPRGQSKEIDLDAVTLNDNPLMPDVWHQNTGVSKPE